MKIKNLQLYLLLALISTSVWGQTKEKRMSFERLKALKINYIIEQVDLNAEEESFVWIAFDKYEKKVSRKYNKKMRSLRYKKFKNLEDLSEVKAGEALDSLIHFRAQKELQDREFMKILRSRLTAKQVVKIHVAEEKFQRKMVYHLRNKKNIP